MTLQQFGERLRSSLWFVPALFALGAFLLALVALAIDDGLSPDPGQLFFLYGGTAEGARSMLSTIAQSMLTFTGLVFTITMLVLQLASSQLSPRVMRTFLRDRGNQVVLGLFVATFVYTLAVLRDVRTSVNGDEGFVPGLSIWIAFTLLLASVGAFIYYIDHMAHAIRANAVISSIAKECEQALDRLYPERAAQGKPERPALGAIPASLVLKARRAGVVVGVDEARLLAVIEHADRRAELAFAVGDFVPFGSALVRLSGRWDRDAAEEVYKAITLGDERTLQQDAAFGFRQLVDVAMRALSPGTNDPTTAVQALDRLHDLLRRLVEREIPSPNRADATGVVRLVAPRPGWNEYVELAIDEIRLAGEGQLQVSRHLRHMLTDLLEVAPPHRQAVLRRELKLTNSGAARSFAEPEDAAAGDSPTSATNAPWRSG